MAPRGPLAGRPRDRPRRGHERGPCGEGRARCRHVGRPARRRPDPGAGPGRRPAARPVPAAGPRARARALRGRTRRGGPCRGPVRGGGRGRARGDRLRAAAAAARREGRGAGRRARDGVRGRRGRLRGRGPHHPRRVHDRPPLRRAARDAGAPRRPHRRAARDLGDDQGPALQPPRARLDARDPRGPDPPAHRRRRRRASACAASSTPRTTWSRGSRCDGPTGEVDRGPFGAPGGDEPLTAADPPDRGRLRRGSPAARDRRRGVARQRRVHPDARRACGGPHAQHAARSVPRPGLPWHRARRAHQPDAVRDLPRPRSLRGHVRARAAPGPRRRRAGDRPARRCGGGTSCRPRNFRSASASRPSEPR